MAAVRNARPCGRLAAKPSGCENDVDGRSGRDSQTAGARRHEREQYRRGARRRVPQRRDRQGEPNRDQAQRRRRRARLPARSASNDRASDAVGCSSPPQSWRPEACLRPVSSTGSGVGIGARSRRGRRDAASAVRGHSRSRLPMAARRSEERRFWLLWAHAGRGPLLLRRSLPDGLSPPKRSARAAMVPFRREFVATDLRTAKSVSATAVRSAESTVRPSWPCLARPGRDPAGSLHRGAQDGQLSGAAPRRPQLFARV
jgi:hypothetical protein